MLYKPCNGGILASSLDKNNRGLRPRKKHGENLANYALLRRGGLHLKTVGTTYGGEPHIDAHRP